MMDSLDAEIREALFELEDLIEFSLSNCLSRSEETKLFSIDEEVIQSLIERVEKFEEEYPAELAKPLSDEIDYASSSTSVDFDGKRSNIFGLSTSEIARLIQRVTERTATELQIISVAGDRGSRALFLKLLSEETSRNSFEKCAMVTVGHEFAEKDILIAVLSQIDDEFDQETGDDDEKLLGDRLNACLKGSKFLVVLDVWGLLNCIPKEDYGFRIILMVEEAEFAQGDKIHQLKSWDLKLFDLVDHIMVGDYIGRHRIRCLFGMAGIGKSTLAAKIFQEPSIQHRFDLRIWVTSGPNYEPDKFLSNILTQIDPDFDNVMNGAQHLSTKASGKRCFVVLDNLWRQDPLDYFHKLFDNISCEILMTTTLQHVSNFSHDVYGMQLLNKEESWRFLCENVFGENLCPRELAEAGQMISEECEGLPLTLATVADFLSEADKTPEYWTTVAMRKNLVFEQVYDITTEKLYPTYEDLPNEDKPVFLYMAVFPTKYKIPTTMLGKLLYYEGLLHQSLSHLRDRVQSFVSRVHSWSLVLAWKKSSRYGTKTCSLHSAYWHLCIRVAKKNSFFHVLNRISDGSEEHVKGQRRLCIQNSVLFGMKDVCSLISSNSTLRSLLCTAPPHPYPLPIPLGSRLLRVLYAHGIRFHEFPNEVLRLALLRYFGLTYDGKLPSDISRLVSLECLIVHRHFNMRLHKAPLYLPKEIWDMKELKHLQVMGSNLLDPCGAVLPNLTTLLDINAHNVMEGVLRGTPNLKKLGIRIELTPDQNAWESMSIFFHLHNLDSLESLKCIVVNPELVRFASTPPVLPLLKCLQKLSLSGLGYPWEYMGAIGELPCLQVLKLQCYAFKGAEWIIREGEYKKLNYLQIQDTDLEYLTIHNANGMFYQLARLIMKHCYKLKKFPFAALKTKLQVELVDCATSASQCIPQNALLIANVHSSWEKNQDYEGIL